jgi:hypothetical protein
MKRLVPRWRKMTWTLWIWTALMFAWMIGGSVDGAHKAAADCATDSAVTSGILTKQDCLDASHAGTGIGVALIFFLWFLGFVVLGFVWFMTRPKPERVVYVQAPPPVDQAG